MTLSVKNITGLTGQKILALNPMVHDFAWFDLWAKPAGLLNLLDFLAHQGNRVELIDCLYEARATKRAFGCWKVRQTEIPKPAVYDGIPRRYYRFGLSPDELRARLAALPRPDLALVTSIMTYWYPGVFEVIKILHQVFPKLPIGLGGIYAELCPEHAARSGADFMVHGPARPHPACTPMNLYHQPGYGILRTSYGCPLNCRYCASSILSPNFSHRPLSEIFNDLATQMNLGTITDMAFYDDALLWKPEERFYPLCEHIIKNYPGLNLHTPNGLSVAAIDRRLADTMFQAGFQTLRLSLEGIDQFTSEVSSNKAGQKAFEKAVKNLLDAGYPSKNLETYILAGLPGQSRNAIEDTINFAKSTGAHPKLCEYSPIPGTAMYAKAVADYPAMTNEPLWHNNTAFTPYLSGLMSQEELQHFKNCCRTI